MRTGGDLRSCRRRFFRAIDASEVGVPLNGMRVRAILANGCVRVGILLPDAALPAEDTLAVGPNRPAGARGRRSGPVGFSSITTYAGLTMPVKARRRAP